MGLSTSFYNERDENLAPALVKILMETNQLIPDFLEEFKPLEGEPIDYSEPEDNAEAFEEANGSGGGWGTTEGNGETSGWGEGAKVEGNADTWGAPAGETTASTEQPAAW